MCVNILPHCIRQSRPCCSLSPSAHTHYPSPACQSPHRSRSPPPISASPNEQQPIPRESPLSPRPLAPRPAAGIPQSNARQEWSLEAAASTRRAGRRRGFAGCQSQEREGLMGQVILVYVRLHDIAIRLLFASKITSSFHHNILCFR